MWFGVHRQVVIEGSVFSALFSPDQGVEVWYSVGDSLSF